MSNTETSEASNHHKNCKSASSFQLTFLRVHRTRIPQAKGEEVKERSMRCLFVAAYLYAPTYLERETYNMAKGAYAQCARRCILCFKWTQI